MSRIYNTSSSLRPMLPTRCNWTWGYGSTLTRIWSGEHFWNLRCPTQLVWLCWCCKSGCILFELKWVNNTAWFFTWRSGGQIRYWWRLVATTMNTFGLSITLKMITLRPVWCSWDAWRQIIIIIILIFLQRLEHFGWVADCRQWTLFHNLNDLTMWSRRDFRFHMRIFSFSKTLTVVLTRSLALWRYANGWYFILIAAMTYRTVFYSRVSFLHCLLKAQGFFHHMLSVLAAGMRNCAFTIQWWLFVYNFVRRCTGTRWFTGPRFFVHWVFPDVVFLVVIATVLTKRFLDMLLMQFCCKGFISLWCRYGVWVWKLSFSLKIICIFHRARVVHFHWRLLDLGGPLKSLIVEQPKANLHLHRKAAIFVNKHSFLNVIVHYNFFNIWTVADTTGLSWCHA